MNTIKTISIIILLFCNNGIMRGQDININKIKKGDYIKDKRVQNFVGNWKWSSGDSSFLISLEKLPYHDIRADLTFDFIVGWYTYTINNVIIYKFSKDNWDGDIKNVSLLGGVLKDDLIKLYIRDPEIIYNGYKYKMSLRNKNKASLTLEYADGPLNIQRRVGIRLPLRLELIRIR